MSKDVLFEGKVAPGFQNWNPIAENRTRNGNKNPQRGLSLNAAKSRWSTFEPACGCRTCKDDFRTVEQQQYDIFAYAGSYTLAQANQTWKFKSDKRDAGNFNLRAKLDQYGDKIAALWATGMTVEARKGVLTDTLPHISVPEYRWPDIAAFYTDGSSIKKRFDLEPDFAVPQLNLPALSEDPSILLTLLESRVSLQPDQLLRVDRREMSTCLNTGHAILHWNKGYLDRLSGGKNVIVPWNADTTHQLGMIGFPIANAILQSQVKIMDFLCRITDMLIRVLRGASGCAAWNRDKVNSFAVFRTPTGISRIAMLPYSGPDLFDIDKILQLANQKWREAKERIFALHTEPLALQELVKNLRATRFLKELGNETEQWEWLASQVWVPALRRAYAWHAIKSRAEMAAQVRLPEPLFGSHTNFQ